MHVQIDQTGEVVGVFANSQGFTIEVSEDDPRVTAFHRAQLTPRIAAECQRRIYAVASQNCQMNMTAWIASGLASDADRTSLQAALAWVQAMRASYASLVAAGDERFTDDDRWPPCPPEAAAFAARF